MSQAPRRVAIRANESFEGDITTLKERWQTTNTSEVLRRAARLAAIVSDPAIDEVHVVKDGQLRRLPPC